MSDSETSEVAVLRSQVATLISDVNKLTAQVTELLVSEAKAAEARAAQTATIADLAGELRASRERTVIALVAQLGADGVPIPRLGEVRVRSLAALTVLVVAVIWSLGLGDVVVIAGQRVVDTYLPAAPLPELAP